MKAYRKRFVQLNIFLIGAVLLIVITVVAVYMYRDYYNGLKATMEQVVEPFETLRDPSSGSGRESMTSKSQDIHEDIEAGKRDGENQKGIMTVFYTPQTKTKSVLSQTSILEGDVLEQVLDAVISEKNDFGTLHYYQIIYYRTGNGKPYKIALTSMDYIKYSMLRLSFVLILVWLGAMLCFLPVSIQLSKLAVHPMEEAMRRERQFVADASHDLKTPLSVILANNSILQENPQASIGSLKKWTDSTQNAAKNMQQLIGEMLTLADIECRDISVEWKEVDFSEIVIKAVLQLESIAYEKNVTLKTDISVHQLIQGNEDYLMRIASCLIENAVKYEPNGGEVQVSLRGFRRQVNLEVRNPGSVISKEDLPHIFERFYRADKSRQKTAGSYGLGLAIAGQMTKRMGGSISAESSVEKGTVFLVSFPN